MTEENKKKRVCVLLWHTPLAMMNVWNLLSRDPEFNDADIDYVSPLWNKDILQFLPNINNIIFTRHLKEHNLLPIRIFQNAYRYLHWEKYINKLFCDKDISDLQRYDIIVSPVYDGAAIILKMANPSAKVYLYEEGTYAYVAKHPFTPNLCDSIALAIIGEKKTTWRCDGLYVNSKATFLAMNSAKGGCVRGLPNIGEMDADMVKTVTESIGGYGALNYSQKKMIYLTQPFASHREIINAFYELVGRDLCVRPHLNDKNLYNEIEIETEKSLWELICARDITDNHILIGAFSTAQVAPKWYFNKEPFVIFTYPYFEKAGFGTYKDSYGKIIETTRKLYSNPKKVFEVKDLSDIPRILEQIKQYES